MIVLILAEILNMIKSVPLAILSNALGFGKKKTWTFRADSATFKRKFTFDQVDSLGQVKAVSQEIQNASHIIKTALKKDSNSGSKEGNAEQLLAIKQQLQSHLQLLDQQIQAVQAEIQSQERMRQQRNAQMAALKTKVDYIV